MREMTVEVDQKIPLVSVGIPTYNRPDGLRRTLECITGQTYKNLEIIISDNCSPGPETENVANEFIARDDRIRYYRQEKNNGAAFNFKFVLEKANGEYFMWMADDDIWEPTFISRLLVFFDNNTEVSVVMCGVKTIDEHGKITSITRYHDFSKPDYNQFKMALYAVTHNAFSVYIYGLHRTKVIKKYAVNLDSTYGNDLIVMTEMLLSTKFGYVDELLHARQVYSKSIGERYSDEELGMNYGDPFNYFSMLFQLGPFLFRSPNIPAKRKLWIPFMVLSQGIWVGGIYTYRTFRFFFRKIFKKNASLR